MHGFFQNGIEQYTLGPGSEQGSLKYASFYRHFDYLVDPRDEQLRGRFKSGRHFSEQVSQHGFKWRCINNNEDVESCRVEIAGRAEQKIG